MPNPEDTVNVVDLLQVLGAWENEIRIAAADMAPASRARLLRIAAEHTREALASVGRVATTVGPLINRDEDTEELLTATVARSEHPGVPVSAPRPTPRAAVREEPAHDDGPEGSADLSQPLSTDETAVAAQPAPAPAPASPLVDFGTNDAMPDFGAIDMPDFGGGDSGLVDFGTNDALPDFGEPAPASAPAASEEPEELEELEPEEEPEPEPKQPEPPAPEPDVLADVPEQDDPTPPLPELTRRPSFVDDEAPLVSVSSDEEEDSTQITSIKHDVRAALEQAKARAPIKRTSSRGPAMQDTFDIAPDANLEHDEVDHDAEVETYEEAGDRPSSRGVVVKPTSFKSEFEADELTNPGAAPLRAATSTPTDGGTKPGVGAPKAAPAPSIGGAKASPPLTGLAKLAAAGGPKTAPPPTVGAPRAAAAASIGGPKVGAAATIGGARAGAAVGIGKGAAAVGVAKASPAAAAAAAGARRPIGGAPLPTIRDATDPKPRSAAIQLGAAPGQSSKVLGFEEEEEPLEMGEAEGDVPEGDGFSLAVEEYEEEEEEEEEEEDEPEPEPEPVPAPAPAPEPQGPDRAVLAALMDKAAEAKDVNDMEAAIAAYSDLLDLDPDHLRAHLERGLIYLAQADYARAMSDFTVAEDLDPKDPNPQVAIGELFYNRKDYRKAIDYFNAAIELDPNHANAFCQRGIAYYYRKEYDDAVRDLTKAQKLNPEIPNITTFLSMAKKKAVPVKK